MTDKAKESFFDVTDIGVLIVIGLLLFGDVDGCSIGGNVFGPPPPFATDGLRVLVVSETDNRDSLTEGQLDVLNAQGAGGVRYWVESHGGEFEIIDPTDLTALGKSAQWMRDAAAVAKPAGATDHWIVAATPKTGFVAPLEDAGAVLKRLEALGIASKVARARGPVRAYTGGQALSLAN